MGVISESDKFSGCLQGKIYKVDSIYEWDLKVWVGGAEIVGEAGSSFFGKRRVGCGTAADYDTAAAALKAAFQAAE